MTNPNEEQIGVNVTGEETADRDSRGNKLEAKKAESDHYVVYHKTGRFPVTVSESRANALIARGTHVASLADADKQTKDRDDAIAKRKQGR